jgi:hypothetical protein
VCRNGAIRWGSGKWVVVSSTLIERYVGLDDQRQLVFPSPTIRIPVSAGG